MNEPVRRLSVMVLVLFLALMGASSYIQVVGAEDLNQDQRNVRTLYREFGNFRGPIVVDGEAVVWSAPVNDSFNYQRSYSHGELYAAVTGYYSIVHGRTGLEQTENALLTGSADALFWTRLGNLIGGQQQQGAAVETTLSHPLQQVAAEQLGDQRGAVVALDPATGAVLAMVTSPTYDPAELAIHSSATVGENYLQLLQRDDGPLINRAIAGNTYPPGSTFKLVIAAAALEAGYRPDTELYAPDELELPHTTSTISNYNNASCADEGYLPLADALRISCNTAFADLGMSLGWGSIERKAHDFGWEESLEIPLTTAASQLPDGPNEPQIAQSSLGQFDVTATPLQMAMVASAIANDGVLMRPYLVDSIRADDLTLVHSTEPEEFRQSLSRADARRLSRMMVDTVASGTGGNARIDGVDVAGKTGTAQTGRNTPAHGWMVSFAPAQDPVVAIAVLVEEGGDYGSGATGGTTAAPIAREVMREALRLDAEGTL